ncbi:futalosine hydrolase [Desulfuribacillus alkaliarsenatis]|uniref:Futalosine hydrolase n=1 Tax=Desulfuribacillus alkaliarsenatis TaxID=766136 RepID=A0A1E5G5E4_9FIRM|nr:futalosine hydrolase [Desulfuribacillus alkaliarsenatis]OEF98386.1 futalosine hydrolase [Desulfuribacillus alkaliarsenatis]
MDYDSLEHDSHISIDNSKLGRFLIVTSVAAEKEAIMKGLKADNRFDVIAAGVGPTIAAANTATALAEKNYQLVINSGIGGGFVGKVELESIVLASEVIAADLGAEAAEGFKSLEELNLGTTRIATDVKYTELVFEGLKARKAPVYTGPIITLSTVTGTASTAATLLERTPGVLAEAMEGYGVAIAAKLKGLPVIEIRSISNAVGPRDRGNWKINEALKRLEEVGSVLTEVL